MTPAETEQHRHDEYTEGHRPVVNPSMELGLSYGEVCPASGLTGDVLPANTGNAGNSCGMAAAKPASDSEEWRRETEAREVARRIPADRLETYLANVERIRGKPAADRLRRDVKAIRVEEKL